MIWCLSCQVGVPPCQQELRGWKGAAPFPVTGETTLAKTPWHILAPQIGDCCPRWTCPRRTSCTCSPQSCQRLLLGQKSEREFLNKQFLYFFCICILKQPFPLFDFYAFSSPVILAVQQKQTTSWQLLMNTKEERWIYIKNDLESDLFIIFLSRCTTWPFPGATQWTKWKEMLPLWQAFLSSDRCPTSLFSFSDLTRLLKYLQLDTEALSFWIISPSMQPYTEVVNLTEMNRFCWTNNHPCAGRNGQGGLRTQTTSSLCSRYLSQ